jgi:hypothetical protein
MEIKEEIHQEAQAGNFHQKGAQCAADCLLFSNPIRGKSNPDSHSASPGIFLAV